MNYLYPLLFLSFFVIILVLVSSLVIYFKSKVIYPYSKVEYLLTPNEQRFFFVLAEAVKDSFFIFPKVRLFDILSLSKELSNKDYYSYRNKIQSKHVDFLICDKETTKPLLAIELDDSSHLNFKVAERDSFVNQAFEQAKLPILHIKSGNYNRNNLINQIRESIN